MKSFFRRSFNVIDILLVLVPFEALPNSLLKSIYTIPFIKGIIYISPPYFLINV